jgi:dihydropteroate synthase
MGVINTTPDSFSDGGTLYQGAVLDLDLCLQRAREMVTAGASILDIGGESTRPGAEAVPLQLEIDRVLPVMEAIQSELEVRISVDTSTPALMTAAAELGAWMINDVRALQRPDAIQAAAQTGCEICLMHMQGQPDTMQVAPEYGNVVAEVGAFLAQRAAACIEAGISRQRLWLDPGFGFGKSLEHNLALLAGLPELAQLGYPLLVGLSRKSMIDKILGRAVDQRLAAGLGLAVLAAERGARIIRTHDVAETVDAVAMVSALQQHLGDSKE